MPLWLRAGLHAAQCRWKTRFPRTRFLNRSTILSGADALLPFHDLWSCENSNEKNFEGFTFFRRFFFSRKFIKFFCFFFLNLSKNSAEKTGGNWDCLEMEIIHENVSFIPVYPSLFVIFSKFCFTWKRRKGKDNYSVNNYWKNHIYLDFSRWFESDFNSIWWLWNNVTRWGKRGGAWHSFINKNTTLNRLLRSSTSVFMRTWMQSRHWYMCTTRIFNYNQ